MPCSSIFVRRSTRPVARAKPVPPTKKKPVEKKVEGDIEEDRSQQEDDEDDVLDADSEEDEEVKAARLRLAKLRSKTVSGPSSLKRKKGCAPSSSKSKAKRGKFVFDAWSDLDAIVDSERRKVKVEDDANVPLVKVRVRALFDCDASFP
jgi:hypothetical protein